VKTWDKIKAYFQEQAKHPGPNNPSNYLLLDSLSGHSASKGELVVTMSVDQIAKPKDLLPLKTSYDDIPVSIGNKIKVVEELAAAFAKSLEDQILFGPPMKKPKKPKKRKKAAKSYAALYPGATISVASWKAPGKGEFNIDFLTDLAHKGLPSEYAKALADEVALPKLLAQYKPFPYELGPMYFKAEKEEFEYNLVAAENYELPDDPLCLHVTGIDEFGA
jgi:hypothetical protein